MKLFLRAIKTLFTFYATALIVLGLYSAITIYLNFNTLLKFLFEDIVITDTWYLNFIIISLLSITSGIVGLIIAILFWKRKEGIERVWLIFITWQFALSLIQKGSYIIGSPDQYEILIVGSIFIVSWLTLFSDRNGVAPSQVAIYKEYSFYFAPKNWAILTFSALKRAI